MKDKISEFVTDKRDEILENCTGKKCQNFYGNGNVLASVCVCVCGMGKVDKLAK